MSKICPECQRDLEAEGISPSAHAIEHWAGVPDAVMSKEGKERRDAVLAFEDGGNA